MKNILGFLVLLAIIGFAIDSCENDTTKSARQTAVDINDTEVDGGKGINFPFVEIIEDSNDGLYDTNCIDEVNPCNCYDYFDGQAIQLTPPDERIAEMYNEILHTDGIQGKAWVLCQTSDQISASAYQTKKKGRHFTIISHHHFSRMTEHSTKYVLAHEVTHGKENHPEKKLSKLWRYTLESETEADHGAGFIMYKLGMSRDEVMNAIHPWVGGVSDTHPVGQDLIDAVMGGYQEAEALYGRLDDRGGRSDGTAYEIGNEWEIEALVHSYLTYIGLGDLKRAYTYHEGYSWLDEFEDNDSWVDEYWDEDAFADFEDEDVDVDVDEKIHEDAGLYDGIKSIEIISNPVLLDVCQLVDGQCQGGRVVVKYLIHYADDDKRYDECYGDGTLVNEVYWVERRPQSLHGYQIVDTQIMSKDCPDNYAGTW